VITASVTMPRFRSPVEWVSMLSMKSYSPCAMPAAKGGGKTAARIGGFAGPFCCL
jgi:hypothetical protein